MSIHTRVQHPALCTTFVGVEHPLSTDDLPVVQFRGIKYASVPARFRQSKLFASYPALTDASRYGPICPQIRYKTFEEEMFGCSLDDAPTQIFNQNEFECLNLNITAPAEIRHETSLPVMVWIHGGGDRGSGSSWVYDGGALVHKSLMLGKPIIMVTLNFRIGLFGCAASAAIRDDNRHAGDEGVGNYGLYDQLHALEWINRFISGFGGDPTNITLFGESTGAADIICHLLSARNDLHPLFHRAIIQSPVFDYNIPDVATAGWHLSRIMSMLRVSTLDELCALSAEKLIGLGGNLRTTDDGVFFRKGWKDSILPYRSHHPLHHSERRSSSHSQVRMKPRSYSRTPRRVSTLSHPPNHQPVIIGDCAFDSSLWLVPASYWTSPAVVRRLNAVCQSLTKATAISHAYDIDAHTPEEELLPHVLDLVNDALVAWPTECIASGVRRERGGHGVWRYVFDQEGPARGEPHHAVDLIYLFDNIPLPKSLRLSMDPSPDFFFDGPFDDSDDEGDGSPLVAKGEGSMITEERLMRAVNVNGVGMVDEEWGVTHVDGWAYSRVRDAIQERWIAFAQGEVPWSEDKVFVFGPEGEAGERSECVFEGRRRKAAWKEVFEPLGMRLVQKVGVELSRGPPLSGTLKM